MNEKLVQINIIKLDGRVSSGRAPMHDSYSDYIDQGNGRLYAVETVRKGKRGFQLIQREDYLQKVKDPKKPNKRSAKRTNNSSDPNKKPNWQFPENWFKNKQTGIDTVSEGEINRLLKQFHPTSPNIMLDEAVLELAYGSGLRTCELIDLRLEQLRLVEGSILVNHLGYERFVPIGKKAISAIQRYLDSGRGHLAKPGHSPTNVFLTSSGERFSMQGGGLDSRLRKRGVQLGLNRITLKRLRDTCAVHLLDNGMDEHDLMAMMGIESNEAMERYLDTALKRKRSEYNKAAATIDLIRG